MKVRVGSRCAARIVVVMVELKKGGRKTSRPKCEGCLVDTSVNICKLWHSRKGGGMLIATSLQGGRVSAYGSHGAWTEQPRPPFERSKQPAAGAFGGSPEAEEGEGRKGKEPSALTFWRVWDDDLLLLQIGVTQ